MDAISFVFLLYLITFSEASSCPKDEDMKPCVCFSGTIRNNVQCQSILNAEELISPMLALANSGTKVYTLTITESSLLYLPENLFENTHISRILLINTEILSLSEADTAFGGLEDSLSSLMVSNTTMDSNWDFNQFRKLYKLREIVLQQVILGTIDSQIKLPNLDRLIITGAEINYVTDGAFSSLPNLFDFSLRDNDITELKRSMFPNPANKLSRLSLSKNQLIYLPKDFFDNMPKLSFVYLDENKFTTLAEEPFSVAFRNFELLSMSGNPFRCDCRMRWLVKIQLPRGFLGKCSTPASLSGKEVRRLDFKSLWC